GDLDAWNNGKPFLYSMDLVAIKIRGAKLELGKVLYGAQAALRAMHLLVEQAPQAHGVETETPLLRPVIRIQVELTSRMAVDVAIETGDAEARLSAFAIVSRVELFLRKGCQEHAQAVELDWGEEVFE